MDKAKRDRLRELAQAATADPWTQVGLRAALDPATVLALLDRIAELEADAEYSYQLALERSERD